MNELSFGIGDFVVTNRGTGKVVAFLTAVQLSDWEHDGGMAVDIPLKKSFAQIELDGGSVVEFPLSDILSNLGQ